MVYSLYIRSATSAVYEKLIVSITTCEFRFDIYVKPFTTADDVCIYVTAFFENIFKDISKAQSLNNKVTHIFI